MGSSGLVLAGRWTLRHRIGEGGTGVVWAAEGADGSPVAVKLVHAGKPVSPTLMHRFEREASGARRIGGRHVVDVKDVGLLPDGRPFLVMERLHGRDLAVALVQEGPLTPHRLLQVLGPVVEVLVACHKVGLVHRDLKPGNVYLARTPEGERVVLLDFGLVKPIDESVAVTAANSMLGTPQFMAPEQARGTRVDTRADVWGLGMLVLVALTGDCYWAGSSTAERVASLLHQQMYAPSRRWTWLPSAFDEWFLRACCRDPEARFLAVDEAFAALAPALEGVWTAPGDSGVLQAPTWTDEPARIDVLPDERTALVGRLDELAELRHELLKRQSGLVSLVGTAGVGKSVLARHCVTALCDAFPHGVVWVSLVTVRNGGAVWEAIASSVRATGSGRARERAVAALLSRRILVALDGLELGAEAAAVLSELLDRCPLMTVLVTSRTPVGLPDETVVGVRPFDVRTAPAEIREHPAIELLVRRASVARLGFTLRDDDLGSAWTVVSSLNGLPLAIELAARRLRGVSIVELAARVSRRFVGDEGATLRSSLEWTHELLDVAARTLYRRVSVFPDSFELSAAAAVADLDGDPLGALCGLIDADLLDVIDDGAGRTRYRMRDIVRSHAAERNRRDDEPVAVSARFLDWGVRLAEAIHDGLNSCDARRWLDAAFRDRVNLDAVREHAETAGNWVVALRLTGALAWAWYLLGAYREGREAVDRALAEAPEDGSAERARALAGSARLALLQCDYFVAEERAQTAVLTWDALGAEAQADSARELLGSVARERGDTALARRIHNDGACRANARNDERGWARAKNLAAFAAWVNGDSAIAEREAAEALVVFSRLDDVEGKTWCGLNRAAGLWYGTGEAAPVREILIGVNAAARRAHFPEGVAWALNLLGLVDIAEGQPGIAWSRLREALDIQRELGDKWRVASVLEGLAMCTFAMGDPERAARLVGAAEAVRGRIGAPVPACEIPARSALLAALSERVGDEASTRFRAAGARAGIERAPV